MKIAVTGASGFIGSYVLPLLIQSGAEVIAATRDKRSLEQYKTLCDIVQIDYHKPSKNSYAALHKPDVLVHLAWGDISNYMALSHYESQLPTHYAFIKNMVNSGLRSVCVAGTCFEYGMRSGVMKEDFLTNPATPYGFAKDSLRRELEFLQKGMDYAFNLTWMRLFYMYGVGQPENTLFSQLRAAVGRGDSIFRMSGGEQLYDYLSVAEVAQKIAFFSQANKDIGIVNICKGEPTSVRALVEGWIRESGWEIELELGYYPYRTAEPMAFWGSKALMEKWLAN